MERFATQGSLAVLAGVGEVRRIDLLSMPADKRTPLFERQARDANAIVFAPWGTYGLESIPGWLDLAPRLEVLSGTFDNRILDTLDVSLSQLVGRGIRVIDTSRSMTPSVAEYCLAMILNLLRDLPNQILLVRRGEWTTEWYDTGPFVSGDLAGRCVGLAGFGVINRTLATLLRPFGCQVATYDPFVGDETLVAFGVERSASLLELARKSEIFVVGIPPTPSTLHIIDREIIEALPNGSLFVLPTRMAVVEQGPLFERTSRGEIRAAIDVYDPEPPPTDARFRRDPNVLPTPHTAGNTQQSHQRCFRTACEEAVASLTGRPLRYEMSERDAAIYSGRSPKTIDD